jgi:arsenical-resistance protein 2
MASTVGDTRTVKAEAEKPWYAAYPAPKVAASVITRETVLSWMLKGKVGGKDFVLVDLRRMDYEVRL